MARAISSTLCRVNAETYCRIFQHAVVKFDDGVRRCWHCGKTEDEINAERATISQKENAHEHR